MISAIQWALETYGPALLQRAINRALQAADIGVDIPNIADSIGRGLPVFSDNTLAQSTDRLKGLFSEASQAGYDYASEVTGKLISDVGCFTPEIPSFSSRTLFR